MPSTRRDVIGLRPLVVKERREVRGGLGVRERVDTSAWQNKIDTYGHNEGTIALATDEGGDGWSMAEMIEGKRIVGGPFLVVGGR